MPIYDFKCPCGATLTVTLTIDHRVTPPCTKCGKPMQRIYNAPGVIFKGKGWGKD